MDAKTGAQPCPTVRGPADFDVAICPGSTTPPYTSDSTRASMPYAGVPL